MIPSEENPELSRKIQKITEDITSSKNKFKSFTEFIQNYYKINREITELFDKYLDDQQIIFHLFSLIQKKVVEEGPILISNLKNLINLFTTQSSYKKNDRYTAFFNMKDIDTINTINGIKHAWQKNYKYIKKLYNIDDDLKELKPINNEDAQRIM